MIDPLLTTAARRYVARMTAAIAPHTGRLDRRYRALLRERGLNTLQVRALVAITPSAASRLSSLKQFLEQAEYNGRRLAKLNVQPDEAKAALQTFSGLLDTELPGQFEPAREQLYLVTVQALNEAYFQVRDAEAQAFFGLSRAEAEATGLDDLLQRFVRILTHAFHANTGRMLLDQPARGRLSRPLFIERGSAAEKLIVDPQMRGRYQSYWSFPMQSSALLQFGFEKRYPWLPREITLLHAVTQRCHEAIEKARLRSEIQRLQAEGRKAEEDERCRIGRELHDEAGQSLLVLRLQLEMMERDAGVEMRSRLVEARGIVEHTVDELRRIVAALSPAVLERLGLRAAIRQLVARFRKMHPATVRVRASGDWEGLSRPYQEVIYRVAQESLQNIVKHSQATRINLLLQSTDKSVRLSITDNGAGFLQGSALSKPMSFGLAGMRERAALLEGSLTIRTAPGKGVRVQLELPQRSSAGNLHGKNSHLVDGRPHFIPEWYPDSAFSGTGSGNRGRSGQRLRRGNHGPADTARRGPDGYRDERHEQL